ncbi:MAG: rod shape-determining protein MreD [Bacteroidia bacterium]|nr:MAG: rod shape-determining protein MreD [Bacteroidia bacterium]
MYIRYILLFIILILVQILLLNNIWVSGYLNPQLYLLAILMLPLYTPGWVLLGSAFLLGLINDMFTDSLAIHAAATVFMAFCRPAVIRLVLGKIYDNETEIPSFSAFGGFSLVIYVVLMVLSHHTVLFFLEIFRLNELGQTLWRIILNSALTSLFVIIFFALLERNLRK